MWLEQYIDFDSKLDKSVCLDLYAKIAILYISQESKNSYMRTWKAFINRMDPTLPKPAMHHIESIKPTYSDEDIKKLITPPKRKRAVEMNSTALLFICFNINFYNVLDAAL